MDNDGLYKADLVCIGLKVTFADSKHVFTRALNKVGLKIIISALLLLSHLHLTTTA